MVGFSYVIAFFSAGHGEITNATGHVWQKYEITVPHHRIRKMDKADLASILEDKSTS